MVVLAGLAGTIALVAGLLLAYAVLSIGLLFFLTLPDEPPYHVLEDVVFVLTLPFVVAVLLASSTRASRIGSR